MFTLFKRQAQRVLVVAATGVLAAAAALTGTAAATEVAPTPDRVRAMAAACAEGTLCVWDQAYGQGHRVDLYYCGFEDVTHHGLSRVGSYVNNQTEGTVATFHGPDPANPGGPWVQQYSSTAFEIRGTDRGFATYGIRVC